MSDAVPQLRATEVIVALAENTGGQPWVTCTVGVTGRPLCLRLAGTYSKNCRRQI